MKRLVIGACALLLCCMLAACSGFTGSTATIAASTSAPLSSSASTPAVTPTLTQTQHESTATVPLITTTQPTAIPEAKSLKKDTDAAKTTTTVKVTATSKATTTAKSTSTVKATTSRTTTAAAVAQEPESGQTVYITDTGEKYHRSGCRYLKKSAHAIAKDRAIAQGYTPCKVCKP